MGEELAPRQHLKVVILEGRRRARDAVVVASRSHPQLVRLLLEQEVPELGRGQITILSLIHILHAPARPRRRPPLHNDFADELRDRSHHVVPAGCGDRVMSAPAKHVLIVEDEDSIRQTLRYNLSQEGFVISEASTGTEALSAARRQRPDLILLDLMLPELSGLEVCRILRQEMTVPIIMLTAKGSELDKVVGLHVCLLYTSRCV